MTAKEAIDWLDPTKWKNTSAEVKLDLLKQVRENLRVHMEDLARADSEMKGIPHDDPSHSFQAGLAYQTTTLPVGGTLSACITLYESLVEGKMLEPLEIHKVSGDRHDILVFPYSGLDKTMYADRKDYIRVKGEPEQVNPLDKEGGIIGVLGAGNYSSSIEMINALFLENCAVVHKPHHLNEETDRIWEKVLKPIHDHNAVSFCASDEGRNLTADKRLKEIYFTGGAGTAQAIMASTDTPFISECGGNNPCIIVPGDKPWTQKQLRHQAIQLATLAKLNGGAVCGRVQTLVTCKNWPQREDFLRELDIAIAEETPAAKTYYPGSDEVFAGFRENYPEAKIYQPENGKYPDSPFMLITGAEEDGYAAKNEAFTQILSEIPLDTPSEAGAFLEKAVEFCNEKLLGTLGSCIIIDERTEANHKAALDKAITNMSYGTVAINTIPPIAFISPYTIWGGNEEGKEFASGEGNFGNLFCFENVEKSIIYSNFMSSGHMLATNKKAFYDMSRQAALFAVEPTWKRFATMTAVILADSFKHKDF